MKYTNQGRQAFDQDELVQTWVIHHLEIIGELYVQSHGILEIIIQRFHGDKSVVCGISSSTLTLELIETVSGV